MNYEPKIQHEIWQNIMQAQLLWLAAIGDDFGVDVAYGFYESKLFIQDPIVYGEVVPLMPEIQDMRHATDMLYQNILHIHGDPHSDGVNYPESVDLFGLTPTQALTEAGLEYIDTVLIGPEQRASHLLASDERLYYSAKTRALYTPEIVTWHNRVRRVIAGADSLLAGSAIKYELKKITEALHGSGS